MTGATPCAAAGCQAPARGRCGHCRGVAYCSVGCQQAAWRTHRPECTPPLAWIPTAMLAAEAAARVPALAGALEEAVAACAAQEAAGVVTADEVYFGSRAVVLAAVPGEVVAFAAGEWAESAAPEDVARVVERAQRLGPAGDIVVPAIPALDIVRVAAGGAAKGAAKGEGVDEALPQELPQELQVPLIKVAGGPGLAGVASGVRSALVKCGGAWFRLKGCGNNADGFVVRTNAAKPSTAHVPEGARAAWRDIRGSAFPHTALRELAMSARVGQVLAAAGVVGCNTAPCGMAVYSGPEQQPLGPGWATACVIERTLGDRRLGTHVLAGLEVILPRLVGRVDTAALLEVFPPARPGRESGDVCQVATTAELVTDYMLPVFAARVAADTPGQRGFAWPDLPRDETTLADLRRGSRGSAGSGGSGKQERAWVERAPAAGDGFPFQFTNSGARPMSKGWQGEWAAAAAELASVLEELEERAGGAGGGESVLAYLFERIGWEAGRMIGAMHQARISWGTYQDAMCHPDQYHCNAHANNLAVVAPGAGGGALLGLLDLDMAFEETTFVDMETGRVGQARDEFSWLLFFEYVNLMEVLAGGDNSTGVPQVAEPVVRASMPAAVGALRTALYDTLVLAYMRGYSGRSGDGGAGGGAAGEAGSRDEVLERGARCVVRLAIAVMAEYVA
eukprot:TRINITY_DN1984_c0_g2_i2.p1 TRINITY_DN1984_c0_g2~~TRINITY_DN1984_c0_g2_i2.p1  ORF type:complete len:678 (-),score=146.88 TRINITY_DN1984_c0_g2_i2:135-2168(-)